MPMLNEHVTQMDEARTDFMDKLETYVNYLREELRVNELILQSVARSISVKDERIMQLDAHLQERRDNLAMHRPSIDAPPVHQAGRAIDSLMRAAGAAVNRMPEATSGGSPSFGSPSSERQAARDHEADNGRT